MNNIDPAARKAADVQAYAAAAKSMRAKLRREWARLIKEHGREVVYETNVNDPMFDRFQELVRAKEVTLQELKNVRALPLSYYGG